MGQNTFYELSRRSILINKNEESLSIWNNSYLTVRTGKGIHFFNFSYNLECLDKVVDVVETSMPIPKHSPARELFRKKVLNHEMLNTELTELVLDSSLWPHNDQLTQEMTIITSLEWSPKGFIHNEGVLTILNNLGNIEIFVLQNYKCESILNFSAHIKQFIEYNSSPKTFKELKESVYKLGIDAMCWSPNINSDNSCFFTTAQKNGTILFWLVQEDVTKTCLQGKIESNISEITILMWIPKLSNKVWLICANVLGQIFLYELDLNKNGVECSNCHTLWQYKDRMLIRHVKYTIINNKIVLVFSKNRHLLVQVIDADCKVTSQYLQNVNDYRITCLTSSIDGFYMATVNFKIYKINISFSDGLVNVVLQPVNIKDTFATCDLHSINFSANNIVFALSVVDRRMLCRKEAIKIDIIFMSTENKIAQVVPMLLSTNLLTDYWDCIEILRYKMVKFKTLPQSDCELIIKNNSKKKLNISLIVAIIYNNLIKIMRIGTIAELTNTSVENIREEILVHKAVSLLKTLYNKYQTEGLLNGLDEEPFAGAKKYLVYYCKKYKQDVSIYVDLSILSILNSSFEYTCQCCEEKIEVFLCKDGHPNNFCSQTFTPIMSNNYLVCKCCNYTVRPELIDKNPLCVFCDLHLINP